VASKYVSKFSELGSGLTWRVILAIAYTAFVFIPTEIYLSLATGTSPTGVPWFALLLMTQIAIMTGSRLTKQESTLIYSFAGGLFIGPIFINRIFSLWFRTSYITAAFGLVEEMIPSWFAPPLATGVWESRTFLSPSWTIPVLIPVTMTVVLGLGSISLGLFAKKIFIEVENLPFPVEKMQAEGILVLVEQSQRKMEVMSMAAVVGSIVGFVVYTLRFIATALELSIPLVPIPWIDYNLSIEKIFPGASFGIATDIFSYAVGFILPFYVVASTFAGSFAVYFIGNWLSATKGLSLGPWWTPGMDIATILQRSIMYVWALPILGIALAAGIIPLLAQPRILRQAFGSFGSKKPSSAFPMLTLLPYLGASLFSTILIYVLAPDFPIAVAGLMNMGFPLVLTLISVRIRAVTGQAFSPGNVNELVVYASGYSGTNAWFTIHNNSWASQMSGFTWSSRFFVAKETETSIRSLIGTFLITLPIVIGISFIFTQLFWSLAKIPSELFPGANIFWPIQATYIGLWTSRPPGLFNPTLILAGFAVMTLISILPVFVSAIPTGLPIAIAAGATLNMPSAFAMLIGSIAAALTSRIYGEKRFNEYKLIIVAGLGMGQGIAVVIGVCIALVAGSMWVLPY